MENSHRELVKYHSRQKHKFIECYLKIWTDNVGNKSKRGVPSLDIVDLYAASGWAESEDAKRYDAGDEKWEGSAILAARCLEGYRFPRSLILNSYNPDPEKQKIQLETLKENISPFRRLRDKVVYASLPIEDAVQWALPKVDPHYPSIWILDPYTPEQLPWHVIETIGNHRATYPKGGGLVERKPELIINLMTSSLQRNIEINPQVVSDAVGLEESEWLPEYQEKIKGRGEMNARQYVLKLFAERLSQYYEKPPIVAEIKSTAQTNIVYCMLLCTDHNAGHYMMKLQGLPELEDWIIYQWGEDAKKITTKKKLEKIGQKDLSDFF